LRYISNPGVTPSALEQQLRSVEDSRKDIDECASISLAKMAGLVDLLFVGSRKRSKPPLRHERAENPNVHLPIAFDGGCYKIDSYRRFAFPNEQLYHIAHFRWSAAVKQITAGAGSAYISDNIVNHNLHNQCPIRLDRAGRVLHTCCIPMLFFDAGNTSSDKRTRVRHPLIMSVVNPRYRDALFRNGHRRRHSSSSSKYQSHALGLLYS
jgi:hypothetical protein